MKRIFISYSHEDEKWKDQLVIHLREKMKGFYIDVWDDQRIRAGENWYTEIKKSLNGADAAILLISSDFLTSDFILKEEIPDMLQRRAKKKMKIFPLIVKPCSWMGIDWLKSIQARQINGNSLSDLDKIDSILSGFAAEIKDILKPKYRLEKITIAKLPKTGRLLFGRKNEIEILDKAWEDDKTCILILVAWGGVGKTALVNEWLNKLQKDNYRGADLVYGWSFYSQGTSEDRQISADDFVDDALRWFGDPDPTQGSPWDKGKRLAGLIRKKKTLLILDGLEPLQYPVGEMQGCLKDQALQALLKELARSNPGLCLVTTRVKIEDIEHTSERSVKHICLEHLTPGVGAELLKHLGVNGTTAELQNASKEFKGHALALNLLGRYLAVVHDGDVQKKDLVLRLTEEEKEGGHAQRVMESYEKFLSGKPELNILYIMGLFDRPAEGGAIEALRAKPWIKGLTKKLRNFSDSQWQYALKYLRDLNLLAEKEKNRPDTLDCHPLIREFFGEKFRNSKPKAWKQSHNRLYEYYKNLPGKKYPDTLKEMEPLYVAVIHGCQAVRHQVVLGEVFWNRILRGDENFSWRMLGSFGSDLRALAGFFTHPWKQLVNDISEDSKAFILNQVGFYLRVFGRLREAVQPMKVAVDVAARRKNWINAARGSNNLSQLYLALGEVMQAVEVGRQSVNFIDRTNEVLWQAVFRTTLADALHQAGEISESEYLFSDAEYKQSRIQPEFPFLYSLQGFQFCDLLLDQGKYLEVKKRTYNSIKISEKNKWLKDIAMDHLSLGRAHWFHTLREGSTDFTATLDYLNRAVKDLQELGWQNYLPLGLMVMASMFRMMKEFSNAWKNLNEAQEIAERGSMKLYLADYHLEAARLCFDEGKKENAKTHLATAKEMIDKMGYHRRDKEVAELGDKLK